jgi:hypothetical protein
MRDPESARLLTLSGFIASCTSLPVLRRRKLTQTLAVVWRSEVFDQFSDRSRQVVFLTRMDAGRRGAAELEPLDLLDAIVREDQGELATRFAGAVTTSGPLRPPDRSFFSPQAASDILSKLEQVLPPKAKPVADFIDIECSSVLGETFATATALAKELHHDKVEPLHLIAALLSIEDSGVAEILEGVGVYRETVAAAIQS